MLLDASYSPHPEHPVPTTEAHAQNKRGTLGLVRCCRLNLMGTWLPGCKGNTAHWLTSYLAAYSRNLSPLVLVS